MNSARHAKRCERGAQHHSIGTSLGYAAEVETVRLRCSCGSEQVEPFDDDGSIRQQIASVSCLFCGRVGQMKRAR